MDRELKRGDVIQVNLNPCLIIQNDIGNKFSPLTIIAVITSQKGFDKKYPTDVWVEQGEGGLISPSIIQCNQIRTIDKNRIIKKFGCLDVPRMVEINKALKISLGLI